ncbi:MAG: Crp/Fnr family transcriptional regulator [Patescibacteria group bacterium]
MADILTRKAGENLLKSFFENYRTFTYKTGETIIQPGDKLTTIYYLESGYVSQQVISENGEDFILNIFKPGSYFPISLVLQGSENEYFYESLTEVRIKKAPIKEVLLFLKNNPQAMEELLLRLSAGLNMLANRTEALVFGDAGRKVAATLYFTAQRFGKTKNKKTIINFPLTHKRIATMTGITRETVSIEMSKLKKSQIIDYQGKQVSVLDMKKLHHSCLCNL